MVTDVFPDRNTDKINTVGRVPGGRGRPQPRNAYDRLGYVVAVGASTAAVAGTLAEAVERINVRVEA